MAWRKLGRLYEPRPLHDKLLTHAANPVPVPLGGDRYRVLFNGRDHRNRSSVGWVDLDIGSGAILRTCDEPAFVHGPDGSFYADGISIGNLYDTPEGMFLPFMGWRAPSGQHWWGELGRFRVADDLMLHLDPAGVWLGLSATDPISVSYPWVMRDAQGGYRMWYGSTHSWDAGNGEMLHALHGAVSKDGHGWSLEGPAVPYAIGQAQAFSRPSVARLDDGAWRMWFSCRSGAGEAYWIGAAASDDLMNWRLLPRDIEPSAEGWDSEMIEYPYAWRHDDRLLLLYNGNGYGATGFGLAEWEAPA
ncbi:hypothetical protein [Ramlibacter humi]|uniref:Glycosyl hydrolase family 32 N-terminal domain-containing protein n=1 Tax=Ramlibacter humi TaxID=2530451 RepID=A0A4Z0C0Q8_9BURK|nr:hypothetical protein [Ramlibacter humi]TFZ03819.1 hypothetical protein EZ216_09205 [Ramlibacter humi]